MLLIKVYIYCVSCLFNKLFTFFLTIFIVQSSMYNKSTKNLRIREMNECIRYKKPHGNWFQYMYIHRIHSCCSLAVFLSITFFSTQLFISQQSLQSYVYSIYNVVSLCGLGKMSLFSFDFNKKVTLSTVCVFLQISFYLNGKCQGVAYENIYEGTYYPAISLYKLSKVLK